ncbi:MAG: hypothetical protein PXX73_08390, partial [Sideroxydans sp.]|nr:hypothetical protein [Sideroxydans sp.]
GAFSAPPLIPTAPTVTDKTIETVPKSRVPHAWGARLLVNAIKLMSIATLLVASALAGFLFSQSRMAKVFVPAASSGEITQAPPASVVTQSEALSEEYVLLESLRMSEHLTLPEPSKKP